METKDSRVEELFREGIDGLKLMLPQWNYRGKWSWYGARAYLCPPRISQAELLTDDDLGATYLGQNPRALRAKLENGTSLLG
jgi:hypothetical protein